MLVKPPPHDRELVQIARANMGDCVTHFLAEHKRAIVGPVLDAYAAHMVTQKALDPETQEILDQIMEAIATEEFAALPPLVEAYLVRVAQDGARLGIEILVEAGEENYASLVKLVNERAVAWAQARSAEMVGRKWVDGILVDNPDARYAITESTRDMVRQAVAQALKEGWSNEHLAKELVGLDGYPFSRERALTIARTELRFADSTANLIAWKESGLVEGKRWLRSNEGYPCEPCQDNADAGVIGIDEDFPSGHQSTPAHPRCECGVAPVVPSEYAEAHPQIQPLDEEDLL